MPVVDVAGAYPRKAVSSVTNDDFLTGLRAARLHVEHGFSRFAFLGVSGTRWSAERKAGFREGIRAGLAGGGHKNGAKAAAAFPAFERDLKWWEGRTGDDGERETPAPGELGAFLAGLEPPVALFACNDTSGLRATDAARRAGIAVPSSIAILGVDNEDVLCELASPSLSSVMLDCEAIGYRAAEALDALMEKGGKAIRLTVPPKGVAERESTLVFACEDELVAKAATYIRTHAHEGIGVADIMRATASSRRRLETRFRKAMGRSLHEEIVRSRLDRAKRLLGETGHTLERIAAESGFGGLQRFHETFKAAEGMSPGAWRKRRGAEPLAQEPGFRGSTGKYTA
jgi:LacI family transcriptional regulator